MWAAIVRGSKRGEQKVVGYFRREHDAVEAQRKAALANRAKELLRRRKRGGVGSKKGKLIYPVLPGDFGRRANATELFTSGKRKAQDPDRFQGDREGEDQSEKLKKIEATSLPPLPHLVPRRHKAWLRENALSMDHMAQISHLHRERAILGRSYNNIARRHNQLVTDHVRKLEEHRRRAREMKEDELSPSGRHDHHHKHHSHYDIFGHTNVEELIAGTGGFSSTTEAKDDDASLHHKELEEKGLEVLALGLQRRETRIKRHCHEPPATPPSYWPSARFRTGPKGIGIA